MSELPDDAERLLRERAWLTALARRLVRRDEVAEDAANDAMAAAVLRGLPRGAGPRRWLAAVLEKQLAGRRRAAHRRLRREQRAASAPEVPAAVDTVARFEVQRVVADAVVALPEPYRTSVLLRFWEGLPPRRIAARVGAPVETVRTRIKRGLAMLRERLDEVHGGDRRAWSVPLLFAARPLGSLSTPALVVSLMTTFQKVVAVAVVALAISLSALWSSASPPPALDVRAAASATAPARGDVEHRPAASADVAEPRRQAVDVPAELEQRLVTGALVDDATGAPMAGVRVELRERSAAGRDRRAVAVSGADGAFVLRDSRDVVSGRLLVVASADDYAPASAFVDVAPRVDVGVLRCVRGARFAGLVVDAGGQPVAGATLMLPFENVSWGGFGPEMMLSAADPVGESDAGGRFALAAPIAPSARHGDLLFAVAEPGIGWVTIEPTRTRRTFDDLVVRLRPNAALRVLVRDPAGRPLADAAATVMPRFGPLGLQRGGRWPDGVAAQVLDRFVARTGEAGEAAFDRLPIGAPVAWAATAASHRSYDLHVVAAGYPPQRPVTVVLHEAQATQVTVQLVAERECDVRVAVRDDTGAPIESARVTARGASSNAVTTGADGRAVLSIAVAGEVALTAERDGHAPARARVSGAALADGEVSLVLTRTRELRGRVVDQFGVGVADLRVFHDGRGLAETDADGAFVVPSFPVGSVPLTIAMPPGSDPTAWLGDGGPTVVDAAAGPATIVWQRRPGRVDVVVDIVDAETGAPLEVLAAQLRLLLPEHGRYLLQKPVRVEPGRVLAAGTAAGRWRLDVRAIDGRRGSLSFELAEGPGSSAQRLALARPGTVLGRLRFVGTAPPDELSLRVQHATADPHAYVQFRNPGRWLAAEGTQSVSGDEHGDTGALRMQPQLDATFRLEQADAADGLVFRVASGRFVGEARVRVQPGATREVVVDVRPR